MNLARLASRVAVGGVATAVATAGMVGVTSTSASAAPVSTTYTCTTPLGSFDVPVTVDIALLPSTAPAGYPVPAGLLSFNSTATVPSTVAPTLTGLGVTGGKSDDFGTSFGAAVAKAPVVWNTATTNPDSSVTFSGKGSNAAFVLPAAGTYSVNMPKQFTLAATKADGSTAVTASCVSAAPAQIGTIKLSKQASVTKAKAPKTAAKGKAVTVKVTVTDDYSKSGGVIPSGKLIIKDGKKKVGKGKLDKKGKAKIKVTGLAAGAHELTVFYKGDKFNEGSKSKVVKVTVKG